MLFGLFLCIFAGYVRFLNGLPEMNNKKLFIYGSLAAVILLAVVGVLFFKLYNPGQRSASTQSREEQPLEASSFEGVPSDAVLIFDFKRLKHFAPLLNDTTSFAVMLLDEKNPLIAFQRQLASFKELENLPFVYSLHYSAKNSVSFLQVLDLSNLALADAVFEKLQTNAASSKRQYNSTYIYSYPSGLNLSFHKKLILASNSSYVLESAIRHLETGTSILDNREFAKLAAENGHKESLYINHRQIGKFFSGEVDGRFLGYSDFFLQFTSWSVLGLEQKGGLLSMEGSFLNNREERNFSTIFYGQPKKKSRMGEILPANTVFAMSFPFTNVSEYLKAFKLYLEVQKKLGRYNAAQQALKGADDSPADWLAKHPIEELVTAYCKFGEKCEWMTFLREKSSFGVGKFISGMVDKKKAIVPEPFRYKGYLGGIFGEIFSYCNEEVSCKVGDWHVIGPKKMVDEFASGNANYFSMEDYLGQTPASGFPGREGALKIAVNLKEAGDTVLQIFKPYLRGLLGTSIARNNFEYLTADIYPGETGNVQISMEFYATRLKELPKPKVREDGKGEVKFAVDSTVAIPVGPFEVKDVVKKEKAYLEQAPNMRLRYLDANKKGVWAVPFTTPICGAVEQVDLFNNGKLQMIFISEDKLYALDRLARFVNGYPVKLPKRVVLGPVLIDAPGSGGQTLMTLNEDNSLSRYHFNGKPVAGWKDIKAPEFIKEMPVLEKIGGRSYWLLRAPSRLFIYTLEGKAVEIVDKKKVIDRESNVKWISGNEVTVTGVDGKEFALDLVTGKTKNIKKK